MVVVVQGAVLRRPDLSAFRCGCALFSSLELTSLRRVIIGRETHQNKKRRQRLKIDRLLLYEPAIVFCHAKSHELNQRAIAISAVLQI
jgi:hypothetical protein